MKEAVRQRAAELGFDDCRFTSATAPASGEQFKHWISQKFHGEMGWLERSIEKRSDVQKVLPEAKSIIVLAASYETPSARHAENVSSDSTRGIVARYARFVDYHDVLAERLKALTGFVNQLGGAPTRSLWYVDTGPILERDLAQRAGLGFVGKHTNIISRRLGNWIFLAEILTTLELVPDAPEKNHCGSCTRCITACPTGAIIAPFQLDARKCISYLTIELKGAIPEELRPAIGNRIYGCDDCLAACPWNKFAREGRLMAGHRRADLDQPELLDLLSLDDAGFKAKFAGTPILRTKRRGLLRNVCIALGNMGDVSIIPHLQKVMTDKEPLIVEHARWAIAQIQTRSSLLDRPSTPN